MDAHPEPAASARMPRVVLFTPGHDEVGGAARRSRLVATGLRDRGWDVRVISRSGTTRRLRWRREPHLQVVEVPGFGLGRLGAVPFLAVGLSLGLLWSRRASALLAVQLMSTSTAAATCSLLTRRPFLAATTTSGPLSETAYLTSRRSGRLRLWLLGRASAFLVQTEGAADEVRRAWPGASVLVVPNPVARPRVTAPLSGRRRACFSGRLSEEKDLPLLLRAWRGIAADDADARLILAGAGGGYRSVEDEIRTLVAADPLLAGTVELTGWLEDPGPTLDGADVFVFPSRTEGMSNSLLEAVARSRVVVASDIPPNRAVLGDDYPLLFAVGDGDDLQSKLRQALDDEPIRTAAQAHLEGRLNRFDPDRVLQQIEEALRAAPRRTRHQLA